MAHTYVVTLIGRDKTQAACLLLETNGITICHKGKRGKPDTDRVIAHIDLRCASVAVTSIY